MKLFYGIALIAVMSIVLSCNGLNNEKSPTDQQTNKSEEKTSIAAVELANVSDKGIVSNNLRESENETADTADQRIPGGSGSPRQTSIAPPQNHDWDKKIVKIATVNAEVKDFKAFYISLHEKVKAFGGYIAQEEQNQSEYKIENSLVIKVPVEQFENALGQCTANTEKINEKKITSQDVTTEVIDTKSRMEAKRQVRLRYLDLLKQAKNMEEILNVQNEINEIQEQIESAAGRISYLGHASSFSTINLTYYQVLNVSAKDQGNPGFGTELANAFRIGWNVLKELFIGIASIWPLLFLIAFLVILYRRSRGPNKITLEKPQANEAVN